MLRCGANHWTGFYMVTASVMKGLMFMHKVSYEFHKNLIWFLTNGLQVNDEYWKITGIHLKFIYLVKLRSNRQATLSLENLKSKNNFEAWGLTLVLIKDQCSQLSLRIVSKFHVKSKRAIFWRSLEFRDVLRRSFIILNTSCSCAFVVHQMVLWSL